MKKIYILCDHGLGNRLASLIGGLTIAKRFNFLPVICWPTNNWCYAEFTDLFDLNFDLADNNFSQSIVEQIQELGLHYCLLLGLPNTTCRYCHHLLGTLGPACPKDSFV